MKVAKQADVIVLAIGGNEQTSREAWNLQAHGRPHQPGSDRPAGELVKAMLATGKPVIVLAVQRPAALDQLCSSENVPVIFECWYLGQETGHAVADVLFGDFNPGGKLPISIPRSVGHLPVFYNYKPSARRGSLFDDVSPLYPFGFGLSYTTFRIQKRPAGEEENQAQRLDAGVGGRDQHRQARRARKWCRCTSATWSVRSRGRSRN